VDPDNLLTNPTAVNVGTIGPPLTERDGGR
jgi:hypothetical protein